MPDLDTSPAAAAGALHARLLGWYADAARDLPWRSADATPWGVLVSEVMLQQTPVSRVLPVWTRWLARWPAPADLAAEPAGEAVRHWDGLGYPRRALRLHAAATAVTERHGGEVPDDVDQLRALPGVGAYTAAAVASFAFGQRHAVVDTNVRRVQARAVSGVARPSASLTAVETRLAELLLPEEPATAARWGVAVMELGALVCTARAPRCDGCPVRDLCAWQRAGAPEALEPPRRPQAWAGTDRQVRGRIVDALRRSPGPLPADALAGVWDDALQRARCLDSLVVDGLVDPLPDGTYALPS